MQHIRWLPDNSSILISDCFIMITVVGIIEMAVFVTVNNHTVWYQRLQQMVNGFFFTTVSV